MLKITVERLTARMKAVRWLGMSVTLANRHAVTYPNTWTCTFRQTFPFFRQDLYRNVQHCHYWCTFNEKQRSRGTNRTAHARSSTGTSAPLTRMASTHSEGALVQQELCTAAQFRRIHVYKFFYLSLSTESFIRKVSRIVLNWSL